MGRLRLLDLFSGIGGFSLGLERSGYFETVAFCEIEPFCHRVLAKHWPEVPCYDDIRTLTADRLKADGIAVDAICGGFPCQDISNAGQRAGMEGARSRLWSEYARLIGELRPRYIIVENVAALLGRGLDRVLGDLAALGYDAEWHCIPAAAVGAPHRRDRLWIVAYPSWVQPGRQEQRAVGERIGIRGQPEFMADSVGQRLEGSAIFGSHITEQLASAKRSCALPDANSQSSRRLAISWGECGQWLIEPDVGRVAHGIPARVDRLRGLGNAVVPQIPEIIGRAIGATL